MERFVRILQCGTVLFCHPSGNIEVNRVKSQSKYLQNTSLDCFLGTLLSCYDLKLRIQNAREQNFPTEGRLM